MINDFVENDLQHNYIEFNIRMFNKTDCLRCALQALIDTKNPKKPKTKSFYYLALPLQE